MWSGWGLPPSIPLSIAGTIGPLPWIRLVFNNYFLCLLWQDTDSALCPRALPVASEAVWGLCLLVVHDVFYAVLRIAYGDSWSQF